MSTNFKEMVQKTVNAEVKTGLRSNTIVWNLDAYCLRGYRPSYNTSLKMQTQGSNNKDFSRSEKPKSKDPKPAPLRNNAAIKPAKKKDRKDKKQRF